MAGVINHLPPIEDLWTPTGGFDFTMEDMPSELKLWGRWSTRDNDTMSPTSNKHSTIRASISTDSGCGSCGVADFELRCRSCGTTSILCLDGNQQPLLPMHACPPPDEGSRPSTTSELARQADSDASDATSLFSTPRFGSEQDDSGAQPKDAKGVASPRNEKSAVTLPSNPAVQPLLSSLIVNGDQAALSPRTMANNWVSKADCPVSTAMVAVLEEQTINNGKGSVPELPVAMDDSNISERDFALRSRSSTVSIASRSIKRKAVRPTPRWEPSEGASSSSAAPSPYNDAMPFQAPEKSIAPEALYQLQAVSCSTPKFEVPPELPAASCATTVEPQPIAGESVKVSPVHELVKELTLSPTDSYFPTAADLTYASLAPLPPSPSRSSIYSTDSYTEDEDLPEDNPRISQIGNAVPYVPYKSEPLPTPTLRTPESSQSSASSNSRSPRSELSITIPKASESNPVPQPKIESDRQAPAPGAKPDTTVSSGPSPSTPHLASQKQAAAEPASATQKKWFERQQGPTEMKFKFVLTPRNGAKVSAGRKKSYVLPQADEDGRVIEPSKSKSSEITNKTDSSTAKSTETKRADESGSSGPASAAPAAGSFPQGVSLAQLARDPNELQRLLACTMFLLNDVPDRDAAPKRLDLGVVPGRSPAAGGYAMKHQPTAEHEKQGMANGVKNVKWRVSMRS